MVFCVEIDAQTVAAQIHAGFTGSQTAFRDELRACDTNEVSQTT